MRVTCFGVQMQEKTHTDMLVFVYVPARVASPLTPHTVTPLMPEWLHDKTDPAPEIYSGTQEQFVDEQHLWLDLKELFQLVCAKSNSW